MYSQPAYTRQSNHSNWNPSNQPEQANRTYPFRQGAPIPIPPPPSTTTSSMSDGGIVHRVNNKEMCNDRLFERNSQNAVFFQPMNNNPTYFVDNYHNHRKNATDVFQSRMMDQVVNHQRPIAGIMDFTKQSEVVQQTIPMMRQ